MTFQYVVYADDVTALLQRLRYPNFTFQSIRRGAATSLNVTSVTAEDARRAIGHKPASTIWERHYVAKRTMVDLQGLFQRGQQRHDLIHEKGLTKDDLAPLTGNIRSQSMSAHPTQKSTTSRPSSFR